MYDLTEKQLEIAGSQVHDSLLKSKKSHVPIYTNIYLMFFSEVVLPIKGTIRDRDSGEPIVVIIEREKAIKLLRDRFQFTTVDQLDHIGEKLLVRGRPDA